MVRSRRGIAVYLVAVLAMILFGLGALLSFRSAFTISSQRRVRHSLEARLLARAGLERSLHHLRHGKTRLTDRFDYGGGVVRLDFQPGSGAFGEPVTDVLARGTFQELSAALYAKVEVDPAFLKASGNSSESTGPPTATTSSVPIHVTLVKHITSVPEETADLAAAETFFRKRIKAANELYVAELSDVTRAEMRWQLHNLAGSVSAGQVTTPP